MGMIGLNSFEEWWSFRLESVCDLGFCGGVGDGNRICIVSLGKRFRVCLVAFFVFSGVFVKYCGDVCLIGVCCMLIVWFVLVELDLRLLICRVWDLFGVFVVEGFDERLDDVLFCCC